MPAWKPTLPPVMVTNTGLLHEPSSSFTIAMPLPLLPASTNPALINLGTMIIPSVIFKRSAGIFSFISLKSFKTFVEASIFSSCLSWPLAAVKSKHMANNKNAADDADSLFITLF